MDKLGEKIRIGQQTERWFNDPATKAVFIELGEDITTLWSKTKSDQSDERERLYRELHGLGALRQRILKRISDGKKAAHEVEENAKRQR